MQEKILQRNVTIHHACVQVQEKILQRNITIHHACVQVQEKILQRNITRVCKCKRRSYNVTSRVCASAKEDLTT